MFLPKAKFRTCAFIVSIAVMFALLVVFFPIEVLYVEINARNLSLRYRSHIEIPHLSIRVSYETQEIVENELSQYLTDTDQLLTAGDKDVWLLRNYYENGEPFGSGEGLLFYNAFLRDETLPRDIAQWCIQNPEKARAFWAEVAKYVEAGRFTWASAMIRELVISNNLRRL